MKKKVMVLFGSNSPEYEVSCKSAAAVIEHMDKTLFDVFKLGITKDNRWILTEAPKEDIEDGYAWQNHESNKDAMLSTSTFAKGLVVFGDTIEVKDVDVIFPVLHGENGEDGSIQGLCQLAGIKYVGSDICSSACSMDKVVTNFFVDYPEMKCPKLYFVEPDDFKLDPKGYALKAEEFHGKTYPVVVKPSKTGSSVGVNVAYDFDQLLEYMTLASELTGKVMVEEFICGREMKVAVVGTDELITGEICEVIVKENAFNDYKLKYLSKGAHKQIPADIPSEVAEQLKDVAKKVYRRLGCTGFARVDFFLTENNELIFNEINTIPGLTEKSIFSLMMAEIGLNYRELLTKLVLDCYNDSL